MFKNYNNIFSGKYSEKIDSKIVRNPHKDFFKDVKVETAQNKGIFAFLKKQSKKKLKILDSIDDEVKVWLLICIKAAGPSEKNKEIANVIASSIKENKRLENELLSFYISDLFIKKEIGDAIAENVANDLGLTKDEFKEIISSWKTVKNKIRRKQMAYENLEQMRELEIQRPGIIKDLYEKYGICNFARYLKEILKRQNKVMNKKEKITKPVLAIIYPYDDYNGAFWSNSERFNYFIIKILMREFEIVITEAKGFEDLINRLNNLKEDYGKVDVAIFGGHGWPGGIILQKNLCFKKEQIKKIKEFFNEKPTIIFNSCSVGKKIDLLLLKWEYSEKLRARTVLLNENFLREGIAKRTSREGILVYSAKEPIDDPVILGYEKRDGRYYFDIIWPTDKYATYLDGKEVKEPKEKNYRFYF